MGICPSPRTHDLPAALLGHVSTASCLLWPRRRTEQVRAARSTVSLVLTDSSTSSYALQLGNIVQSSDTSTGRPCLIGECGIPFDMNAFFRLHPTPSGKGKKRDFRWQERQLDALCTGLERSLTSYVLWNYNPENEDTHGDSWYMENFSLFSMSEWDEETGKQGAGRCMDAFQVCL